MPRRENRIDGERKNCRCATFLSQNNRTIAKWRGSWKKMFYAKLQSPLIFIKIQNPLYKISTNVSIKNKVAERTNLTMPIYEFTNIFHLIKRLIK